MQDSWIDQNEIDELVGSFKGAGPKRAPRTSPDFAKVAELPASPLLPATPPTVKRELPAPEVAAVPAVSYLDEPAGSEETERHQTRNSFWDDDLDLTPLEGPATPSERDAAKAAQSLGEARRRADESQLLKAPSPLSELEPRPTIPAELPPPLPEIEAITSVDQPKETILIDPDITMSRRIALLLEQLRSDLAPRFVAITDDKGFLLHGDDILNRGHTPEPRDVFQTQRFFGDHAEEVIQVCDGGGWWYIRIPAAWPHAQVSWQLETKGPIEMTTARRFAKLLAETMFPVNHNDAGERATLPE
jgi:hypothetical protein